MLVLRRLDSQHVNHQIYLIFQDIVCLAINYYLEKKNVLSFTFYIMIIYYISIQNYVKEINTMWKCPLLPSLIKSCSQNLISFIWQVSTVLKKLMVKEKKALTFSLFNQNNKNLNRQHLKKKCPLILIDLLLVHTRVYHIWRTNQIQ